jgi:predicted transposase/invertase (TIGR01784 family)
MANSLTNPHDAYFRAVMSHPVDAAGELRAIMPPELVARIDWDRLSLEPGSYVDDELRSRYSDVLFSTHTTDGHEALIYILVEHQSRPDRFMPIRLLEYIIRIWWQYIHDHDNPSTVPLIIPVVVYTGPGTRKWTTPTDLTDLIDADPDTLRAAGPHVPRMRYLLDNISDTTLHAIHTRHLTPEMETMLMLQKTIFTSRNIVEQLRPYQDRIRAAALRDKMIITTYYLTHRQTNPEEKKAFTDILDTGGEHTMATFAEDYRAEGEARGRTIGQVEGRRNSLLELLTIRFGPLPKTVDDTIQQGTLDQIHAWFTRAAVATGFDEVFAG